MGELFLVRTVLIPHSCSFPIKKSQLTHRQEHHDSPQNACGPASHVRGTHWIRKDLYPAPAFDAVLRYAREKDHLHHTKSRRGDELPERGRILREGRIYHRYRAARTQYQPASNLLR